VFTQFLYGAACMLFPFRLFDDEEAVRIYNQYLSYMLPRLFVGAIKDVDDLLVAMEDFVYSALLIEDED